MSMSWASLSSRRAIIVPVSFRILYYKIRSVGDPIIGLFRSLLYLFIRTGTGAQVIIVGVLKGPGPVPEPLVS